MKLVVSSDSKQSFSVRLDGVSIQFEDICSTKSINIEKDDDKFSVDVISLEQCIESAVAPTVESVDDTVELVQEHEVNDEAYDLYSEEALFVELVGLRTEISKELSVPPYIVFNNKTLREMSKVCPLDLEALSHISGVGEAKLEKYGDRFIESIVEFVRSERKSS